MKIHSSQVYKPFRYSAKSSERDWLIIYYGAGDNNLRDYLFSDLNQLEEIGSNDWRHLVGVFDAGTREWKHPISIKPPFKGAKIFYLNPDGNPLKLSSEEIEDLGQVNMANYKFMADVITRLIKKFPAKHVAVIISDHGEGWKGAIEDTSHASWMELSELQRAFSEIYKRTGRKIDLLGWDACLMASTEVAYALAPFVKLMVASEEFEGGDGWPYGELLSKAIRGVSAPPTPEELAHQLVKAASQTPEEIQTLSAIDLSEMALLREKVNALSREIIRLSSNPDAKEALREVLKSSERFGGGRYSYIDIFDFARMIVRSENLKDPELKRAAEELYELRNKLILYHYRNEETHPHAFGMQVEGNTYNVKKKAYKSTSWAKDTLWDEAIAKLSKWYR